MGICESPNEQKAAANQASASINNPTVGNNTQSKGILDNVLGTNTNANQNNI